MDFSEILAARGAEAGLSFTTAQLSDFQLYYEKLVTANTKMNLTTLTTPEEVAVKHIIDSLLAFDVSFANKTVVDVGTGAGFPGLPLKIYCPSIKLILIDSLKKRLHFLEDVIAALGLPAVNCVHMRAEDAGRDIKHREKYDIVTARAVARLSVLAEYCLPLVKLGGRFVALKGSQYQTEIAEAQQAIQILGGGPAIPTPVQLPGLADGRAVITIIKNKTTPACYPRKAGVPEKQPLASKVKEYGK